MAPFSRWNGAYVEYLKSSWLDLATRAINVSDKYYCLIFFFIFDRSFQIFGSYQKKNRLNN